VIVSAPSGAGKTTLCHRIIDKANGSAVFSVSCTTRRPRPGEENGREYWFLSEDDFLRRVEANEFLEHAKVHDHYYGTLKQTVGEHLSAGRDVFLDIDVQGAEQIRATSSLRMNEDQVLPLEAFLCQVFLLPPSMEILEARLRGRASDPEDEVRQRMRNAHAELTHWTKYDHVVINDDLELATAQVQEILRVERTRIARFIALSGER
jgi:guanylate kinase